jgi:ribosomal protein S18 acetylase RimI-like enzyme
VAWEALRGSEVTYAHSAVESARFDVTLGRLTVGHDAPPVTAARRLTAVLEAATDDVLVTRYPAHLVGLGSGLAASGRAVIPAGSLTYWEVEASRLAKSAGAPRAVRGSWPATTASGLVIGPADSLSDDVERGLASQAVRGIVTGSFLGYGNHYLCNPMLDPDRALDGYVDWALRSLAASGADVMLAWQSGEPVGVATLHASADGSDLEILLAGLVPAAQGRGWYPELLSAVGRAAVERGCSRVIISTQCHNVRVQRSWAKAGLLPFATVETVHLVPADVLRSRQVAG